eukprot:m.192702 g.192702  ORF g.192702 m.192702 type:complete len:636 (-) comp32479_c1_seq3:66-1973(-)
MRYPWPFMMIKTRVDLIVVAPLILIFGSVAHSNSHDRDVAQQIHLLPQVATDDFATNVAGVHAWACGGAGYDGTQPPSFYSDLCYEQVLSNLPQNHSLKGWFMRLHWSQVEPHDGVYDWSEFDHNITKAVGLGLKINPVIFINDQCTFSSNTDCPNGSSTPAWIYDVSPRVELKRASITNMLTGKLVSAPYYLDPVFQGRFQRLVVAFLAHLQTLPVEIGQSVWAVQAALGITGDSRPWDGFPVNASYDITGDEWVAYCRKMSLFFLETFTPRNISVLTNLDNPAYNQSDAGWWVQKSNTAGIRNPSFKEGIVSHGYQLNGEAQLYDTVASLLLTPLPDGSFPRARGELALEPDPNNGTYGNWAVSPAWSLQANAEWMLTFGVDVWNLYSGFLSNTTFAPTIDFFNTHSGLKDVATATAAFISFRDALNTEDTDRWPTSTFGPVVNLTHGHPHLNPVRMVSIANANAARGARQDDPTQGASNKSVVQKKGMFLNDVGYQTWGGNDGNYARYLEQEAPRNTSVGWWRLGPKSQGYGRFARGLEHSSGKSAIKVNINTEFGVGKKATIRVVYFDLGFGRWTLRYCSEQTVMTVSKSNSSRWQTSSGVVPITRGCTSLEISSLDGEDDVFSLMELLLD